MRPVNVIANQLDGEDLVSSRITGNVNEYALEYSWTTDPTGQVPSNYVTAVNADVVDSSGLLIKGQTKRVTVNVAYGLGTSELINATKATAVKPNGQKINLPVTNSGSSTFHIDTTYYTSDYSYIRFLLAGGVSGQQQYPLGGELYIYGSAPSIYAEDATVEYGSAWSNDIAKRVTNLQAYDRDGRNVNHTVDVGGKVDTSKPGRYPITFYMQEGPMKTVYITVKYKGDFEPTISAQNFFMDLNESWTNDDLKRKANVVATDTEGKDALDQVIVVSSGLDTSKVGEYPVTFYLPIGTTSFPLQTVTATVLDANTPDPEIVANDFNIGYNEKWNDADLIKKANVKATDGHGNDITNQVTVSTNLDTSVLGKQDVTFSVTFNGKTVSQTVQANVVANGELTLTAENFTMEYNEKWNDADLIRKANAQAVSSQGEDISDNINVYMTDLDTSVPGKYIVMFVVAENGQNKLKSVTATVNPPRPDIIGEDFFMNYMEEWTDQDLIEKANVVATDGMGNDITSTVWVSTLLDTSVVGSQIVIFLVNNEYGADAVTVHATIREPVNPPVIQGNDFDLEFQEHWTDKYLIQKANVVATDGYGNDIADAVKVSTDLDTNVPGQYEVTFSVVANDIEVEVTVIATVIHRGKVNFVFVPRRFDFGYTNAPNEMVYDEQSGFDYYVVISDRRYGGNTWKVTGAALELPNISTPSAESIKYGYLTMRGEQRSYNGDGNQPSEGNNIGDPSETAPSVVENIVLPTNGSSVEVMSRSLDEDDGYAALKLNDIQLTIPRNSAKDGDMYRSRVRWTLDDTI